MNKTDIGSEAKRTNVRGVVPQATTIVLIALCLAVVSLLTVGCETEKTGYEKDIAAWEECMDSELEVIRARAIEVRNKYRPLFKRQPNYMGSKWGTFVNEDTGRPDYNRKGIIVKVSEKMDQSTLPEADRIPACLDGVPVQLQEGDWETTVG